MDGVDRFLEHLRQHGLKVRRRGELAVVELNIVEGPLRGDEVEVGTDPPADYPNVPPHWLHLPAALSLKHGTGQASELGTGYLKWSRPHPRWIGDDRSGRRWVAHTRSLLAEVA